MESGFLQAKIYYPMAKVGPCLFIIFLLALSGILVALNFGRDASIEPVIPLIVVLSEFLLSLGLALVITLPYKVTVTNEVVCSISILAKDYIDVRNWFAIITPDNKWRRRGESTYLFSPGNLIRLPNKLGGTSVTLQDAGAGNGIGSRDGALLPGSCRNYSRLRILKWGRHYCLIAAAATSLCLLALFNDLGFSHGFAAKLIGLLIASGAFTMFIADHLFTREVLRLGARCGDLEFILDWVYSGTKGIEDQIGSIMVRNFVGVDPHVYCEHRMVRIINKLIHKVPNSMSVRSLMPILGSVGDRETLRLLMRLRSSKLISVDAQYSNRIDDVIRGIKLRQL